jgi:hypothetical protein
MKHTYSYILILTLLISVVLTGCQTSEYSEEEQQTMIEAEKAHYMALDEFADAFDKLNILTSLLDSVQYQLNEADRYMGIEGTNTDSLQGVSMRQGSVKDQLIGARNELLEWADSIYGLPDTESVYSGDNPNEMPSIAKDEFNDMLENNIRYEELPEGITPAELLELQKEQLSEIQAIHQRINDAIENANTSFAEIL